MNPLGEWISNLKDYGLEFVAKRFYAKYPAVVVNNVDPLQQGRVQVKIELFGHTTSNVRWCYPSAPFAGTNYGMYFPPEIGDHVWVWFDHGDPSHPHYSGGWYLNPSGTAATSHIPAEFVTLPGKPPQYRGITTKGGHGIAFRDENPLDPLSQNGTAFWAGEHATGVPVPQVESTKISYLALNLKLKVVQLSANLGQHFLRMVHDGVSDYISLANISGAELLMQQTMKLNYFKSAANRKLELNDTTQKTTISTPSHHKVEINDVLGTLTITSATGQKIEINSQTTTTTIQNTPTQTIIQSPAGTVINDLLAVSISAQGGVSFGSGIAAVPVPIPGAMVETGAGEKYMNFTGLVTENISGGMTTSVTGNLTTSVNGDMTTTVTGVAATTATKEATLQSKVAHAEPIPASVTVGSVNAPKGYLLVHEEFIKIFNEHVHLAPGVKPLKQIVPPSTSSAVVPDPAVAPDIDERSVITRHTKAS